MLIISNTSICNNSVNTTSHGQLYCFVEEINLRLPIRNIAMDIVKVAVPSLLTNLSNKGFAACIVYVPDYNICSMLCPFLKEAFTKARSSSCYQDCLPSKPSRVVRFRGID